MTTLLDAMKGQFIARDEFLDLQKAVTTGSGSAGDIIEPELEPQLQNQVFNTYKFYTWLRSMGCISGTRSNKPSYLKKLTGGAGGFISEGGSLTAVTDSTYDLLTGTMTTWNFGIEITDQMIMGSQDSIVDIVSQEIQDGMEAHYADVDNGILTGDGTSNTITGLQSLFTTNTENMAGDQITDKFQLDDMVQQIMDAGGLPGALVTNGNVKSQIEEVLFPNINISLTPKLNVGFQEGGVTFGYQATQYDSPAGPIPIVIDQHMPSTTDQQRIFFPDARTLRLKYLMEPRVIDLAKTKLTTPQVLASFQSFYCRAENWNGQIYNIGTKTS